MRKNSAPRNHWMNVLVFSIFLFATAAVSAEPATPSATPTPAETVASDVATPAPEEPGQPAADCDQSATDMSFSDLVATPDDWKAQDTSTCQYTCPQNLVLLCPSFPGYTVSCHSGCCIYTRV